MSSRKQATRESLAQKLAKNREAQKRWQRKLTMAHNKTRKLKEAEAAMVRRINRMEEAAQEQEAVAEAMSGVVSGRKLKRGGRS